MITLVALSAIGLAVFYEVALGHSGPAGNATSAVNAGSAPATTRTVPTSAPSSTPAHPQASPHPKARHPVTASTTNPQPAAGSQPQAGGSTPAAPSAPATPPARTRDLGYVGPAGRRPWYGAYGRWPGGFGFSGPRGWGWRF